MSPAAIDELPLAQRVFRALSDGALHSGEQLAREQDVSRNAVWKAIGSLEALGLALEVAPNRGYRLPAPLVPLSAEAITGALAPATRARLRRGEVAWSIGSTNDELLARAEPAPGQFDFLVAEHQSGGRGRRARPWFAPPGGALCLSIGWSCAALPPGAPSLSLAVGVCALRALRGFGAGGVQLKWPNDLVTGAGKLGGILIELRAESAGPAYFVIGIGMNTALPAALVSQVEQTGTRPVDLAALGALAVDRNRLCAALVDELVAGALAFEAQGLAPFAQEWRAADALVGHVVTVQVPGGVFVGHARGIDAEGALCVQGPLGMQRFASGEVSVRAQP
jgi:BirA family biotin operon repressor/biotin-[acetyl-CoA-carboxylase] ligase